MRIIKRIILFPVYILVSIIKMCMKVVIEAEYYIAGMCVLILTVFAFIAIFNGMWKELGIIGLLFCGIVFVLFISIVVQVAFEIAIELLR